MSLQIHAALRCFLWLTISPIKTISGDKGEKMFMADFKDRLRELCTVQRERIHVWFKSLHVFFNDNYKQAWRHLWFAMQICTGHGQNTTGCICRQKNKLVLANKSKTLNSSQKNNSSAAASNFHAFLCEWESLCFRFHSHLASRFYTLWRAATD